MRKWLVFGAMVAWIAAVASTGVRAQASAVAEFDVPKQPLETALRKVADSQNLQIIFTPSDVRGITTAGVKGKLTAVEAVQKLLDGTELTAVYKNNAIAIKPKSANDKGGQAGNPTVLAQAQNAERRDQAASSDQRPVRGEGIVVTAQKREQRLMDVPSSVAVVTRDEMDRRGLVNGEDYLRGTPGVNQMDGFNGQSIVIRGMETALTFQSFFAGTTVATYFGETPTTYSAGLGGGTNIDLKLVDIERVEVLRGPQGTAFGNSSLGGAVRTIPTPPKLDRFEGSVVAGYSATSGTGGDNYTSHVVLNVPLVDEKVAIRAVAYKSQDSGYYRNVAGSNAAFQAAAVTPYHAQAFAIDESKVGSYGVYGGRIAAILQASSDLRFTLSYLSQRTQTDGIPVATSGTYEQTVLQVAPEHVVRGQTGGLFDTSIDTANAVMEYNLGWANVLATYSYTKSGSMYSVPYTSLMLNWPASQNSSSDHREYVGEIRLATQLTGPWNFLAGLYGESLKDDYINNILWYGDPATNFFGPGQRALGDRVDKRSRGQKAAFGEASWDILQRLTLTGGVRAYEYDPTFQVNTSGAFYGTNNVQQDSKASGATGRANLSYKFDDALAYAGWSQGFRLGQLQLGLPASQCDKNGDGIVDGTNITLESTKILNSDKVNSYELGSKFTLLDRHLTVAADAFRMQWSGVPVNIRIGSAAAGGCGLLTYLANAGNAQSDGVELQANYQITKAFRVDVGASWINARLTEDVPALNASKGNRLPGAPKVNANLGLQYEFLVGGYRASMRADAVYVGPFYGDLLQSPILKAGDYVKLDAAARVDIRDFSIDFFVRNLTNKDAFTNRGTITSVGPFYGYRLRPRTVGLRFGYTF